MEVGLRLYHGGRQPHPSKQRLCEPCTQHVRRCGGPGEQEAEEGKASREDLEARLEAQTVKAKAAAEACAAAEVRAATAEAARDAADAARLAAERARRCSTEISPQTWHPWRVLSMLTHSQPSDSMM